LERLLLRYTSDFPAIYQPVPVGGTADFQLEKIYTISDNLFLLGTFLDRHEVLYLRSLELTRDEYHKNKSYTNYLHEALLCKSGPAFWKRWKAIFANKTTNIIQVDGIVDNATIVVSFANHFDSICTPFNAVRNRKLKDAYNERRVSYIASQIIHSLLFDVDLISNLIAKMDNGKAAGLDELSSEHLNIKYCHPIVICLLTKLFNLFISPVHIPVGFGASYTVPNPKCDGHTRALS